MTPSKSTQFNGYVSPDEFVTVSFGEMSYCGDTLRATSPDRQFGAYAVMIYDGGKVYSIHAHTPLALKRGRDLVLAHIRESYPLNHGDFRHVGGIGTNAPYYIL